jgi:uncharacterized membrane protein YbaN (DUF454 family)
MADEQRKSTRAGGLVRYVLLIAGVLLALLAFVGAFLPVLPTTPFLLVAAACFARSSPAFHRRLLATPVFGPYLAQWQQDRTIPSGAKRKAYGLVALTFTLSIVWVEATSLRVLLGVLGIALLGFLARLPTSARRADVDSSRD